MRTPTSTARSSSVSREVRTFSPTWQDRHFRKSVERLSPEARNERALQVSSLVKALQECANPVTDPRLRPWWPSTYKGVIRVQGGHLVEYRFPGVMRVIACCFDSTALPSCQGLVLLLTVTLDHDHDRMKRLLREHSGGISQFGRDFSQIPPGARFVIQGAGPAGGWVSIPPGRRNPDASSCRNARAPTGAPPALPLCSPPHGRPASPSPRG